MDAPSLELFKGTLARDFSNLIKWKPSLPMTRGEDWQEVGWGVEGDLD